MFSLSAPGLSRIRGEAKSMSCPTSSGGLAAALLGASGVFVRRSARGPLPDGRATAASGLLQKSMSGRSSGAVATASTARLS